MTSTPAILANAITCREGKPRLLSKDYAKRRDRVLKLLRQEVREERKERRAKKRKSAGPLFERRAA